MIELFRPALLTGVRTGLFLSLTAWCLTRWWVVEWTGVWAGRPLAVTVYDQGLLVADMGLESMTSQWTIRAAAADFDPRAPGPGETMVQAISPVPGTAFLWSGDTVLGFRHPFAITGLSGLLLLLHMNNSVARRRSDRGIRSGT